MSMKTEGKIHATFEAQQVTERFRKREFVLELEGSSRYPQTVLFQLTGDRCGELDGFNVGEAVSVEFSLRGREWKSPKGEIRYFNSLEVWSLERAGGGDAGDDFDQSGTFSSGGTFSTGGSGSSGGDDPPPPTDDDEIPF